MFKQKNALIAVAVAMLVAACGGGGGDDPPAGQTQNPPGNTNPGGNIPKADDSLMTGHLELVNQVQVNENPIAYSAFTGGGGWGFEKGTHSPLQKFGIRVDSVLTPVQNKDAARIAIDIRDASAANIIQLMIDKVKLASDATGELTVTVDPTAKAYVYAKTAAGAVNGVSAGALPAGIISLVQIDPLDLDSKMLSVNIEAAIAAAKGTSTSPVYTALPDLTGKYNLSFTVSNVALRIGSAPDGTGGTPLVGETITVTGAQQAPVPGGGVKGVVWLNTTTEPPATPAP